MPFALDKLPECFEQEPNDTLASAQKVTLPIIINGRIDRPDDWDVFQFAGKSNDTVVAEVQARRLDSPLDSVIKLTDAAGNLLAFNDDHEDLGAGVNTHHADSYFMARLPADGTYYVHIGDTAQQGGEEYGYRLRLSAPQPDFELRVVPSSLSLRAKSSATLTVYAMRKDGFTGPIKLGLKDPPAGFSASPVTLSGTQTVGAAYHQDQPGCDPGPCHSVHLRQREDRGPGGRPPSRAVRRPDAGLPVAAPRPGQRPQGAGLRPRLPTSTQTPGPSPSSSIGRHQRSGPRTTDHGPRGRCRNQRHRRN